MGFNRIYPRVNIQKTMERSTNLNGKIHENPLLHGKSSESMDDLEVPGLVNVDITMERSTNFNGKTHYFYDHFQ